MRKTLQDGWDELTRLYEHVGAAEILTDTRRLYPEWTPMQQQSAAEEILFAKRWVKAGRITYELTHSMAALMALTSAADISLLPHEAFAIKVPREFFPMEGHRASSDSWIAVARAGDTTVIFAIADCDSTAESITYCSNYVGGEAFEKLDRSKIEHEGRGDDPRVLTLSCRFATNTIAYILEHRDCVAPRFQGKSVEPRRSITYEVRPPHDITIDRAFRTAAKAAVCATSLVGIRRALQHFVRGHWRNQAVGANRIDRRRTWVKPHRRGDESLGSVVARLERLYVPETP